MTTRSLNFGTIRFGGEEYTVNVAVTGANATSPTQDKIDDAVKTAVHREITALLASHARMWGAKNPRTPAPPLPPKFIITEKEVQYVADRSSRAQTHLSDLQNKAATQWKKFEQRFISEAASPSVPSDPTGGVDVTPRTVTAAVTRVTPPAKRVPDSKANGMERSDSNISLPTELDGNGSDTGASDIEGPLERQDSGLLSGLFAKAKAALPGGNSAGGMRMIDTSSNPVGRPPEEALPEEHTQYRPLSIPQPRNGATQNGAPSLSLAPTFGNPTKPRSSEAAPAGYGTLRRQAYAATETQQKKAEKVESTIPAGHKFDPQKWERFHKYYLRVIDGTTTLEKLIATEAERQDVELLTQMQTICKAELAFRTRKTEAANATTTQAGQPLGLADRVPTIEEVTKQLLRYQIKLCEQEIEALQRPPTFSDLGEL